MACALAIGGLDPGGGAGLAADLRAFSVAGVFGAAAIAVVTVQSTAGLRSARTLSAREVSAQAEEVIAHQRVRAVKVGALGSEANVRAVGELMRAHRDIPFVVDTPMHPSRGRGRLLAARALRAMKEELLPRAMLVTVNLKEAEALTGRAVRTLGAAHEAAGALASTGARAVLVKGGHGRGAEAIDVLWIEDQVIELRAKRLAVGPVHGTGCAFASLVAGRIARRQAARPGRAELVEAIRWAKRTLHAALGRVADVGGPSRVVVY